MCSTVRMCTYRNNKPLKGYFSEILWELCNCTCTQCSSTSMFSALSFYHVTLLWLMNPTLQPPSAVVFRYTSLQQRGRILPWTGERCLPWSWQGAPRQGCNKPWYLFLVPVLACYVTFCQGKDKAFIFCLGSRKANEIAADSQDGGEASFTIFWVITSTSGTINLTEVIPEKSKIKRWIWNSTDCS